MEAEPTTRLARLLDTVWITTSHTATSTAVAVRDIEWGPHGQGLITIMADRAAMATPVHRNTMMRAHRNSTPIVRPRRHVQRLRSQPARAVVVAPAVDIRAEVSAGVGPASDGGGIRAESAGGRGPRATFICVSS